MRKLTPVHTYALAVFVIGLSLFAALVAPIKQRLREILAGGGDGWSSRTLRLIQRFRKSVHEAR